MAGYICDFYDGVVFECMHLRRERGEVHGELTVYCDWKNAVTFVDEKGPDKRPILSKADFNFSGLEARQRRAKHLLARAKSNGKIDFDLRLEQFCYHTLQAIGEGDPSVPIDECVDAPDVDDFVIEGVSFPRKHPAIIFGDGAAAKSYFALFVAGRLAYQHIPVIYLDWELEGGDHRSRFMRIFGRNGRKPELRYMRCALPLAREAERIGREIRKHQIRYAVVDSLSFATEEGLEMQEAANRYWQACREFDIGSLHVAHINKQEGGDSKPYGSVFWYNGARSIWFAKAERSGPNLLQLQLQHRKANCGPLRSPVNFRIQFTSQQTSFERLSGEVSP